LSILKAQATPLVQETNQMHHEYVDGIAVRPLVIDADARLGPHQGGVIVAHGVHLDLTGPHQGSLQLQPGASASIHDHQGSLHIAGTAQAVIVGRQQGSSHVDAGGRLEVAERGQLQGSIHSDGIVINRGKRGGSEHGGGTIIDELGSAVVQPTYKNGSTVYQW
jgi:hypothetical protein